MVRTPEEPIMGEKTHETSSYDSVMGVVQVWWFVNLEEDVINCWNLFIEKWAWDWSRKNKQGVSRLEKGHRSWWRKTLWTEAMVYSKAWERMRTLCVMQIWKTGRRRRRWAWRVELYLRKQSAFRIWILFNRPPEVRGCLWTGKAGYGEAPSGSKETLWRDEPDKRETVNGAWSVSCRVWGRDKAGLHWNQQPGDRKKR